MGIMYSPLSLFPSLNETHISVSHQQIVGQANGALHLVGSREGFRFFFYKTNDQVYQIISNEDVTDIYQVKVIEV
jgi:hypothetical protein